MDSRNQAGRGRNSRDRGVSRDRSKRPDNAASGKSNTKKILLISGLFVAAILIVVMVYIQSKFSTMNQEINSGDYTMPPVLTEEPGATGLPEADDNELSQIKEIGNKTTNPNDLFTQEKVVNILLLGLDTRNPEQFKGGRTDSIIIVTLDTVNKEIKLTSIMRDTLLSVPDHDMNRINTIYGFCGPDVTMDVIQKYFKIKIDYYAVVNFWAVANIIDSVGGVDLEVKKAEISNLNQNLAEINAYNKDADSPNVKKSGMQTLNGKQAVAYMRIRHVGEADFERTERQRRVLEAITKKDFSLGEILKLVDNLPKNVRTNMRQLEMANLAQVAFGLKGAPIKQFRIPSEGTFKMSRYKGMSILIVDFDKNAQKLKEYIQAK